jgi:hypothetical protein
MAARDITGRKNEHGQSELALDELKWKPLRYSVLGLGKKSGGKASHIIVISGKDACQGDKLRHARRFPFNLSSVKLITVLATSRLCQRRTLCNLRRDILSRDIGKLK